MVSDFNSLTQRVLTTWHAVLVLLSQYASESNTFDNTNQSVLWCIKEKCHGVCVVAWTWFQCMLLCVVVWYQTMNQDKMARLANDQTNEVIRMLKNSTENDVAQHFRGHRRTIERLVRKRQANGTVKDLPRS